MLSKKCTYESPLILRERSFACGSTILAGSIIDDKGDTKTAAQETEDVSEGETFDFSW